MKEECTAKELSAVMGCSVQAVSKRVKDVDFVMVSGKTRPVKAYRVCSLPDDFRKKIAATMAVSVGENKAEALCQSSSKISDLLSIDESALKVAHARASFIKTAGDYCRTAGYSFRRGCSRTKKGEIDFLNLYSEGRIPAHSELFDIIGTVSWSTLNRWFARYAIGGVAGLVDNYHNPKKGSTSLTPEQRDYVAALLVKNPHSSLVNIRRGLQGAEKNLEVPSVHVIKNYIDRWKAENKELWQVCLNPAGWKNKLMFACGDAAGGVERLYQLVEGDSSPTDLMLNTDGKLVRHSLIALIDIYSRQAQLIVAPTSSGNAIVAALRRWFLGKGVMEAVRIDNGKDWISKRVSSVLYDLEVDTNLCGKFKSEEKGTVERFFRTFSHGIMELCPHFIGHNVSQRQAINEQQTFAQRIMKTGGDPVELAATPEEFQEFCDKWTDIVYFNDRHSTLKCSPAEMVRNWRHPVRRITDERVLDNLLLPAAHRGGIRKIGKKGVQVDSGPLYPYYAAEEFYDHAGDSVYVFIDPLNMGRVVCYLAKDNGKREYLCEAVNLEWKGINRAEFASKLKKKQNEYIKAEKRKLNRLVKNAAIEEVHKNYMALREEQHSKIINIPNRVEEVVTQAVKEAAKVGAVSPPVAAGRKAKTNISYLASDSELYDQLRLALKSSARSLTDREASFLKGFYRTLSGKAALQLHGNIAEKYGVIKRNFANG